MTSRLELEAVLTGMGDEPSPRPTASFVTDLEDRLRLRAIETLIEAEPDVAAPASPVRRFYGMPAGAVAAAVLAALGLAVAGIADTQLRTPSATPVAGSSAGALVGSVDEAADPADPGDPDVTASSGSAVMAPTGEHSLVPPTEAATTDETGAGSVTTTPAIAAFTLEATQSAAGPTLKWDRAGAEDFGAYVVFRSASPDDPSFEVYRTDAADKTEWHDPTISTQSTRYVVVVVDDAGEVIARSNVVEVRASANARAVLPRTTLVTPL